jgi:hypothetical protein
LRQHGTEHLDGSLVESPVIDDHRKGRVKEAPDSLRGRARADDDAHPSHEACERGPLGGAGFDPRDVR